MTLSPSAKYTNEFLYPWGRLSDLGTCKIFISTVFPNRSVTFSCSTNRLGMLVHYANTTTYRVKERI